jgi:hypothetical protein
MSGTINEQTWHRMTEEIRLCLTNRFYRIRERNSENRLCGLLTS